MFIAAPHRFHRQRTRTGSMGWSCGSEGMQAPSFSEQSCAVTASGDLSTACRSSGVRGNAISREAGVSCGRSSDAVKVAFASAIGLAVPSESNMIAPDRHRSASGSGSQARVLDATGLMGSADPPAGKLFPLRSDDHPQGSSGRDQALPAVPRAYPLAAEAVQLPALHQRAVRQTPSPARGGHRGRPAAVIASRISHATKIAAVERAMTWTSRAR
jgi:hypothetical protein